MDLQLKGRKAIVLGATRGIGWSIAETLAREGADVAICARNGEEVKAAVSALGRFGGAATGAPVDIGDGPALKAWIKQSAEAMGGLHILVSSASALVNSPSEDDWEKMFRIDVMGAVRALEAARPFLETAAAQSGDAAFIIVSSISAAEATSLSAYGPMKAALIHLAKGAARELAAKHVRVNVVSPGTILFEGGVWGNVRKGAPAFFEQMIKRNPTGRMGGPQEIADAAAFLACPLSAFTTGSNLVVDGAISARVNF